MNQWKSAASLVTAALMTMTLLTGCNSPSNTGPGNDPTGGNTDTYKIAIVPKMTGLGWFERMEEGIKAYNTQNHTEYYYGGPSEGEDQANFVESLLAEDWDAICVVPFDSQSLAPILKKARDAGIIVITHEAASMDPQYFDYDIEAFLNADYGENFSRQLVELTNGEGTYVQFVGSLSSVSHNEWCDAADAYFSANSNMTKKGRYETKDSAIEAYNKTKELLQSDPSIVAIEGSGSTDIQGAAQAVSELGKAGQVAIVGTSMTSICGEYVSNGTIASFSVWDPAEAGKAMIELAVAVLDSDDHTIDPSAISLNAQGYESVVAGEGTPTVLYGSARVDVNKENMDDYDF